MPWGAPRAGAGGHPRRVIAAGAGAEQGLRSHRPRVHQVVMYEKPAARGVYP